MARKRGYYNYKKKYGSSLVKRARGNLKASKKGTDQAQFTVNFTHPFVLGGKEYNAANNAVLQAWGIPADKYHYGVQCLNVWDLLARASNFQAFQQMYDQCRIDYVKVKLQVTNSTIETNTTTTTYDLYTVWDRTGISSGDMIPVVNPESGGKCTGVAVIIDKAIAEYSGVTKLQLNAYQRWKQNKSIWPNSLMEKSQFVNTSDIKQWRGKFNTSTLTYDFNSEQQIANNDYNSYKDLLNGNNPAVFVENQKFPFKPTLLIGAFQTGVSSNEANSFQSLGDETKIVMTADFEVSLTFRGLRGKPTIT